MREIILKKLRILSCCACFSLLLAGCGAPRLASINEKGLKPINDLKYYPDLTESERRKFAKTYPDVGRTSSEKNRKGLGQSILSNDSM